MSDTGWRISVNGRDSVPCSSPSGFVEVEVSLYDLLGMVVPVQLEIEAAVYVGRGLVISVQEEGDWARSVIMFSEPIELVRRLP